MDPETSASTTPDGGIVTVALTFIPQLLRIPLLGRILTLLAPGGGNDFEAIEALQRQADARKTERKTRIDRNARYVLKASDAMKCVEDNIASGGFLLSIGKGILSSVLGGANVVDVVCDRIFSCIESKTLKQTGPRVRKTGRWYGRPAKGHGKGKA